MPIRMPTTRRALLAVTAAIGGALLAGCASPPPAEPFLPWSERFADDWMCQIPELTTISRYFPAEEQARLDAQVSDVSEAARERRLQRARAGVAQLDRYLASALPQRERVLAQTMRWSLARVLASAPYEYHGFAFAQTFGVQVRYMNLFAEGQPLRRAADLPAFLARLRSMPQRIDAELDRTKRAAQRGLMPPRFIVERARQQIRMLTESPLEVEPGLAALQRRIEPVSDLSAEAKAAAIAEATQIVGGLIRPAWVRVGAYLDELLPRTNDDAGLWRLPEGGKAYAQALAANTTTEMSADEIHRIGLREVGRIEAEMDRLLKSLGHGSGSVIERMAALRQQHQPPAEPDPRPALLQRYVEMTRDVQRRAEPLFNLKPRAPVDVRRVPALTERTASAYYTPPTRDGERPGVFWVPMPQPLHDTLRMRALVVHEAVPGHHFQIALQQEARDTPRWMQQRVFSGGSAFSEGWGLYAEHLAIEQGWYEGDMPSLVGALGMQLFRAKRLVVDTGLHAMRWTRQQAIDYGISPQEVERYVVNPGQACAYMVGMLRILQLRDEARAAQGVASSDVAWLRDFHDVVLKAGTPPLDVLAEVVREWTRGRGRRA
jgi:uncharacterized protein (DUF885 family)